MYVVYTFKSFELERRELDSIGRLEPIEKEVQLLRSSGVRRKKGTRFWDWFCSAFHFLLVRLGSIIFAQRNVVRVFEDWGLGVA